MVEVGYLDGQRERLQQPKTEADNGLLCRRRRSTVRHHRLNPQSRKI